MQKVIDENRLQFQGMIDPKSAKELGKILGVDAIATGTIADDGETLRINARFISTETGKGLSGVALTVVKDDRVKRLLGATVERTTRASDKKPQSVFHEDFSNYDDGAVATGWGAAKAVTGDDGRKWILPIGPGRPVGQNFEPSDHGYIAFDYHEFVSGGRGILGVGLINSIVLVDEKGKKFRIAWTLEHVGYRNRQCNSTLKFPSGAAMTTRPEDSNGTVCIRWQSDAVMVTADGSDLTENASGFGKFTRFEINVVDRKSDGPGSNAMIEFTNFKSICLAV